jgi:glycine betaine/proline transport system substrate-binding protein
MTWLTRWLLIACALMTGTAAQACELNRPIVFAGLDWDSVGFHNAVARHILEVGYGCRTDVIPGSTIPLLQGVAQGDIDVAMEVWKDAVTEVWQRAMTRGQVTEIGINFPDAVQGWYVPRYVTTAHPELQSVRDLAKFKALFIDPEEPAKGRFYNCVAGWACEVVNTNKLQAYGLAAHFTNFRPGTGTALAAAISGAWLRKEPIVAYYWGPTWVLGAYDMVKLQEPAWNDQDWKGIAASAVYPRPVDFPVVEVWIGANAKFAKSAPQTTAFLAKYRTSGKMVSDALAFMRATNATEKQAALNFLRTQRDVWTGWVPADIAARVQASLGS